MSASTVSTWTLFRNSLVHYWRIHLSVVAAVAICTAVLVGALLVGDSMRGSLRALTLDRLGAIDHVVLAEVFVREDLAQDLRESPGFSERFDRVEPALLLQGSVTQPTSGRRAAAVNIQGVEESFAELFPGSDTALALERGEGQPFASAVINRVLATELGVAVGDEVLVALQRPSEVPRESLMGSTDTADLVQTVRLVVRQILADAGPGRFGLMPHQTLPANLYLGLSDLQRALDQRGRVNALLVSGSPEQTEVLRQLVASVASLEDYGLETESDGDILRVTSREIVLRPPLEEFLLQFAREEAAAALPISTYLANRTRIISETSSETRGRSDGSSQRERELLPYSTIAALPNEISPQFGQLRLVGGGEPEPLAEDQILLNAWAAEDLGASPGDRLEIEYWEIGDSEQLVARTVELVLTGVVAVEGLAADGDLTPEFPGVYDAEDMSDWDPTFPVDLSLIEERDEEYWDLYRGTPKLFVTETLGRDLWGSRFGELTSLRLSPQAGESALALADRLGERLKRQVELRAAGVEVRGIKDRSLQAARGATDFSGLFIGFSLFLIVAAALLVALFFRLGTEQRSGEVGTLLAVGTPLSKVRRALLREAVLLAAVGVLIGTGLALGYAALMVWGLSTVWVGATGTKLLELHVTGLSLVAGALGSLILVVAVLWGSVRKLAGFSTVALLRRDLRPSGDAVLRSGRRSRWVLGLAMVVAVGCFIASFAVPTHLAAPLFIGLGAALLVAGLAGFALWITARRRRLITSSGAAGQIRLAAANVSLVPGRSLLSVALVSSATFVIVAVGAYGHRFGDESERRDSGAGGYDLRAVADVPLYHELASADGRFELGFSQQESELLQGAEVYGFAVVPGDDVSCLNLYQPTEPKLVGVPADFRRRGGFSFQQLATETDDPWALLDERLEDGAIPVFGDFNSVMWILKSGLGQDVVVENERGEALRLRIVGLLRRSIFQSELLMSEEILRAEFPSRGGSREFLIDTPLEQRQQVAEVLEQRLGRFGFDTRTTTQVLQSFQAVENTYLSTFQVLGGLGLLLGTLGLAVVLLRGVLERGPELATLRAVGFSARRLGSTVLAENSVLLAVGVALGALSALVAVAPHLLGGQAFVPWFSLLLTLVAVFAFGTLASAAAVRYVVRLPLLATLRGD